MSPIDQIFIVEKPMPLIPSDNPIGVQALKTVLDKSQNILKGFVPVYAQGSLNVNIKRYFTDANGTVIAKATAPASMQIDYPVFLLGNFDRVGSYNIGQKIIKCKATFIITYVHGYSDPFLLNTGFNNVKDNFKNGDIVTVFADSYNAPTTYCFIVQTVDIGALASIISNSQTQQQDGVIGKIQVKNISYQVDVESQIVKTWQMVALDNLGAFNQKPFDPITYKQPLYKLNDFIELPLSFLLTQFTGIYFPMDFTSDSINVNMRISK